jgi:hypothetical protein
MNYGKVMLVGSAVLIFIAILTASAVEVLKANNMENDGGDRFQSVSGDFARAWLKDNLNVTPSSPLKNLSNDLWDWGGLPRGKSLVNGVLTDSRLVYVANNNSNWLSEYYVPSSSQTRKPDEWVPPEDLDN